MRRSELSSAATGGFSADTLRSGHAIDRSTRCNTLKFNQLIPLRGDGILEAQNAV